MSEWAAGYCNRIDRAVVSSFHLQIILGWLGDKKINVTILYAFCMILCGVIVFMVPSFITFEVMRFLSAVRP